MGRSQHSMQQRCRHTEAEGETAEREEHDAARALCCQILSLHRVVRISSGPQLPVAAECQCRDAHLATAWLRWYQLQETVIVSPVVQASRSHSRRYALAWSHLVADQCSPKRLCVVGYNHNTCTQEILLLLNKLVTVLHQLLIWSKSAPG